MIFSAVSMAGQCDIARQLKGLFKLVFWHFSAFVYREHKEGTHTTINRDVPTLHYMTEGNSQHSLVIALAQACVEQLNVCFDRKVQYIAEPLIKAKQKPLMLCKGKTESCTGIYGFYWKASFYYGSMEKHMHIPFLQPIFTDGGKCIAPYQLQ